MKFQQNLKFPSQNDKLLYPNWFTYTLFLLFFLVSQKSDLISDN